MRAIILIIFMVLCFGTCKAQDVFKYSVTYYEDYESEGEEGDYYPHANTFTVSSDLLIWDSENAGIREFKLAGYEKSEDGTIIVHWWDEGFEGDDKSYHQITFTEDEAELMGYELYEYYYKN